MNTGRRLGEAVPVVLACVTFAAASAAAMASQGEGPQHVNIEASKTITTQRARTASPEDVAYLTQRVAYGDLDLATAAGARQLTSRIEKAATAVCAQLGELYPAGSFAMEAFERASCFNGAVDGAMSQARTAIVAAREAKLR